MKVKINNLISKVLEKSFPKSANINFSITAPPPGQGGDLAANAAFALAKRLKKSPKEIAAKLAAQLALTPEIERAQVGGDGFLNLTLSQDFLTDQVAEILEKGSEFGASTVNKGKKARVEFISANPTGPLHIGNARGGPLGDVIANVLSATGYKVLREYIDNDRGNQVQQLGETLAVFAGFLKKPQTELAYNAPYAIELAQKLKNQSKNPQKLGEFGVKMLFDEIIADAKAMGIAFDQIVHESDLQKKIPEVLSQLKDKKLLTEHDGAVWFKYGNKEAVVKKSGGEYVYFTADIVYHKQKFTGGYDLVVDVLGSNTIGHVPKLRALADFYGFDQAKFKVPLYQFVRVKRGAEVVKMSKRAGNFVTAREVLDEVGKDAFRFFMLLHDANTHMDFDLELAKKKSQENPVYYVQYAAVRCKSILRKSEILISKSETNHKSQITDPKMEFAERKLVVQLAMLPDLVEEISKTFKVHQLTHYGIETAKMFHDFYEKLPVIKSDKVNESRLAIVKATLIVLQNALQLLGVGVPDHM